MPAEHDRITAIVDAEQPEAERQCRAAAAAAAFQQGKVLVGTPHRRRVQHKRATYIEMTWELAPAPPDPTEEVGWVVKR